MTPIPRISPGLPENIFPPPPKLDEELPTATADSTPTMTESTHLDCEVLKTDMALYDMYGLVDHSVDH